MALNTLRAMALIEEAASDIHLEWDAPLFRTAITQFEQALPYAGIRRRRGAPPLPGAGA